LNIIKRLKPLDITDRRLGFDRRVFSYAGYVPERRIEERRFFCDGRFKLKNRKEVFKMDFQTEIIVRKYFLSWIESSGQDKAAWAELEKFYKLDPVGTRLLLLDIIDVYLRKMIIYMEDISKSICKLSE